MNKNSLIVSGKYNYFLIERKEIFKHNLEPNDYIFYLDNFTEEEAKECIKIYKADKQRKYRLFNKLVEWFFAVKEIPIYEENDIVFFTLTWTEEDLKNTNKQTRRKYIERFLKENTLNYIANIDYGEENDREHYHAIAVIDKEIDIKKWQRISWIKRVNKKSKDLRKITKYILKLTNHSYKESTKREKAIYSRNNWLLDFYINQNKEELFRFKIKVKQNLT